MTAIEYPGPPVNHVEAIVRTKRRMWIQVRRMGTLISSYDDPDPAVSCVCVSASSFFVS
jgi:hypothetical protein